MSEVEAINAALEAYRQPTAFRASSRMRLPGGMLTLIKLASASPEEVRNLVTDETAEQLPVREAAIFYLQQLLTKAESDHRQLALAEDATLQDLKDHKRWLLKWLHPDRNPNSWESLLFKRVSASAMRLEAALREGVRPDTGFVTRRSAHRETLGNWQIAQRRVARVVGWRTRVIKMVVATALLAVLVAAAQILLTVVQGGQMSLAFHADTAVAGGFLALGIAQ